MSEETNKTWLFTLFPHSFFYKNIVFPPQAEYSYFPADFRLKIFLYYSNTEAYVISVVAPIYWGINVLFIELVISVKHLTLVSAVF